MDGLKLHISPTDEAGTLTIHRLTGDTPSDVSAPLVVAGILRGRGDRTLRFAGPDYTDGKDEWDNFCWG